MNPESSEHKDPIAYLIRKSLTGSLSPSEHTILEEWLKADPINQKLYKQVTLQYNQDVAASSQQTDIDAPVSEKDCLPGEKI